MKCSDNLDKIAPAMVELQADIENMEPTGRNPFTESKFIPLPEMLDYLRPLFHKHKLACVQLPAGDGKPGLTNIIIHQSGQYISETLQVDMEPEKKKSLAQVVGSYITYLRRYSLAAVVGLTSDEDIDGSHGKPGARSVSPPAAEPTDRGEPEPDKAKQIVSEISAVLKGLKAKELMEVEAVKKWWNRAMRCVDDIPSLQKTLADLYAARSAAERELEAVDPEEGPL